MAKLGSIIPLTLQIYVNTKTFVYIALNEIQAMKSCCWRN